MFRVPKITSVWRVDGKSPVGTMKFAPELIKFIKDRRKYQTYRFADNKYLQMRVGDKVIIKENFVEDPIGEALITKITKTTFTNIPLIDEGHELTKNKEHQRQVLSGYYSFLGRPIADDDPFLIVFEPANTSSANGEHEQATKSGSEQVITCNSLRGGPLSLS